MKNFMPIHLLSRWNGQIPSKTQFTKTFTGRNWKCEKCCNYMASLSDSGQVNNTNLFETLPEKSKTKNTC